MDNKITREQKLSALGDFVASTVYQTNEKTTICIATLNNGFDVVGVSNVVVKSHFDRTLGRRYAFEAALSKIDELLAFQAHGKLEKIAPNLEPKFSND